MKKIFPTLTVLLSIFLIHVSPAYAQAPVVGGAKQAASAVLPVTQVTNDCKTACAASQVTSVVEQSTPNKTRVPPDKFLLIIPLVIVGMTLLLAPVWRYYQHGWLSRKSEIINILQDGSMEEYLKHFDHNSKGAPKKTPAERFEEIYNQNYGRSSFYLPLLLLFLSSLIAITLTILTSLHLVGFIEQPLLFDLPVPATTALAGAYMWVANDFISRARRRDFSASDVYWANLRIVIAIPIGYAFKSLAAEPIAPFITFALGAFPLDAIMFSMRRLANNKLNLGIEGATDEERRDDIVKLQGVNVQIIERLRNEDVASIPQLAYCDPVRLSIRSNLSFTFITDCMNQSLAWMYFQEKMDQLRPLGLRGAVEIRNFVTALDIDPLTASPEHLIIHNRAMSALPGIASAAAIDAAALQITLHEISDDPYTEFLSSIWK